MYLFKDDGIFGNDLILRKTGPGDMVRNSLVFAWAFMETSMWFWVSPKLTTTYELGLLTLSRSS